MSSVKQNTTLCVSKDLSVTGDSALVNRSRPPSVIQYHRLFYEHSSIPCNDQSQIATEKIQDFHEVPNKQQHTNKIYLDSSLGNEKPNSGFFQPKATFCMKEEPYVKEQGSYSSFLRPASAYSYKGNTTRPSSGKAFSRNSSRADSALTIRQYYASPELEIDPDHEPIADVLSRLGNYTENFLPNTALAYTECECTKTDERVPSRLAKVYSSFDEEEEEDAQDVRLDILLRTFKQYEDKGHSAVRQKAMLTLINSSQIDREIKEDELEQVMFYLMKSLSQVREACLVLIKQLVKNQSNLLFFLERDILSYLNQCLMSPNMFDLRRHALLLAEEIFTNHQFKEKWLDFVISTFFPKLLSMVRGQTPLDVKYAACCVFRSLAQYEEFISYVTEDILPSVILLRNASAKFKEVYVEILTTVLSHTDSIPPDLVDSSAIPITLSIIREGPCGPQCAALQLLTSLTTGDNGVAVVTGTNNLVAMILACMKDSRCRKVKLNALQVMKQLSRIRKFGLCKDLMLQLSGYLLPNIEEDSITTLSQATSKSPSPTKPRFDEERHMWQGLEKFIELLKEIIFKEGKVETDELGLLVAVHLRPGVDAGEIQLKMLTTAFQLLQSICVWPLDKSRLGFSASRIDLTSLLDNEKQRHLLSKINRGLTQIIWDKVGTVACDLLSSYSRWLQQQQAPTVASDKNHSRDLSLFFDAEEIILMRSILQFLLCTSLCTCVAFPDLLPKLEESSSKRKLKSKLKSSSSSSVLPEYSSSNIQSQLKSQSDVPKGFRQEEKLWVKENPHLTQIHPLNGSYSSTAVAKSKAELQHKEACTDRRLLRKCLYEAGVFQSVCPFMKCSQPDIQEVVLQILRCLVHPLEERVVPKVSFTAKGSSSRGHRPQTAGAVPDANRRLNMAMHKMSPEIAKLINEALGSEQKNDEKTEIKKEKPEVKKTICNIPNSSSGLESIHERLQDFTLAVNQEKQKKEEKERKKKECLLIDRCRPIAEQCRETLLMETEGSLLEGIFSKSQSVKKQCVLLLYDVVQHGELDIHMKLSTYGCIPKLVDFLRVHENHELLEVIGLIIARILVSSDPRLRQLFDRHGGQQLLLSMAQYNKGLIKQEVSATLKTISQLDMPRKKRPMSAPAGRQQTIQKVPDIWDHIQERWKQEDQVTEVLRKWSLEDRKLHRRK